MAYLRFSFSNWYIYESVAFPCTLSVYHVNGAYFLVHIDAAETIFHEGFEKLRKLVQDEGKFSEVDLRELYEVVREWYLDARDCPDD